jgi:O-antigen ligase
MRFREWVAAGSGVAAVGVAIFALGSTPRWAQGVVAGIVAIAVLSQLPSRRMFAKTPPLLLILAIAAVLTTLQLIPLGESIVSWFNPTGAALRADGAAVAGVPCAQTLTMDKPGTLGALTFFLTLLGVASVALRIAVSERGRFGLLATVAGACGLTAAIVGAHALVGTHLLYGVYEPLHASPPVLGPLLNDNQLGCLMALGAAVAGGLIFYRRQPVWSRVAWVSIAAGCGVVAMATLSRGAAIALVCGGIVLGAILVGQRVVRDTQRRGPRAFATGSLPIGIVAVCSVVMVIYASSGSVARQLESTSFHELSEPRSKFAAWRSAAQLIEESPWAGWGRGAFEPAFTRVHPASGLATFSYLENEYLQVVVDWGLPGALLLGVAGVWFLITALWRWRGGPLAAAAIAGLGVVALQSNVDFGVEFLGLAIPTTIVAATLSYVPLREPASRALYLARGLRAGLALAIVFGGIALLSAATISVGEDHDLTVDSRSLTGEQVRAPIERHPLDYRGYLLQAIVMMRDHDPRAIHVLNHALVLHPTHSGLHVFAGELLRRSGNLEQAAIEYASAIRSTTNPSRLIELIVGRLPNAHYVALSIPADDLRFYDILRTLEQLHRTDIAIEWLQRVLAADTDRLRTCTALYGLAARSRQMAVIAVASEKCPQYQPTAQVKHWLARTALDAHDDATAIRLLGDVERWNGSVSDKLEAWLMLCDAHLDEGHLEDAERCLHRLDATGYAPKREIIAKRLDAVKKARVERDTPQPPPPSFQALTSWQQKIVQALASFVRAELAGLL